VLLVAATTLLCLHQPTACGVQVLNRDLSILMIQTFAELRAFEAAAKTERKAARRMAEAAAAAAKAARAAGATEEEAAAAGASATPAPLFVPAGISQPPADAPPCPPLHPPAGATPAQLAAAAAEGAAAPWGLEADWCVL